MFFDMTYLVVVALPAMVISGAAAFMVKHNFAKYSNVGTRRGLSGREAAQLLLDQAGIHDVQVVRTEGYLSDHYNPMNKTLALSDAVYDSRSVAAVGVATHEAGHAIQHAHMYAPLWLRSALVPTVGIGSQFGTLLMGLGLIMSKYLVIAGAVLFGAVVLFQLVTLPVEFNATNRAKDLVVQAGIIDMDERRGMDAVLNAAAMTYVAAAVSSILTLLYYLWRAGLLGGSNQDE